MAQCLVSFILQAGETLPATEWNPPGKTSEVTFNISQSGRDGKEGLWKASYLFKLPCKLILRKSHYLKQASVRVGD